MVNCIYKLQMKDVVFMSKFPFFTVTVLIPRPFKSHASTTPPFSSALKEKLSRILSSFEQTRKCYLIRLNKNIRCFFLWDIIFRISKLTDSSESRYFNLRTPLSFNVFLISSSRYTSLVTVMRGRLVVTVR